MARPSPSGRLLFTLRLTLIEMTGGILIGTLLALARLSPIAPLEIGMVRLARHRVDIRFEGLSADAEEAFMRRFTLHYQRGGG